MNLEPIKEDENYVEFYITYKTRDKNYQTSQLHTFLLD